ncbi:MAG: hypothetical protein OXP66_14125 [Candidatus Tectomicrobia bacterium]|nr:hypothetical protein [Candidatus Tectomicrobia bacterium]
MATAQDILAWVARTVWEDDHDGNACPLHQLPVEADLYQFIEDAWKRPSPLTKSALAAFSIRVGDFYRSAGLYPGPETDVMPRIDRRRRCVEIATPPRTSPRIEDRLEDLHRHWINVGKPAPHPLASLVRAWQRRQQPIDPDRRQRGIVPSVLVRREHGLDRLPDLVPPEEPGIVTPPLQDHLPRLHPDDDKRKIPALLALFDAATGSQIMRDGVHLSLAIFVEALLSVPRDAPLGLGRVGPFTIGEIAADWLQWNKTHYRANKAGTGIALRKALLKVHNLAVPIGNHGGWYFPLIVRGVEGMRWDDRIAFLAEIIGGAQVGPAVDRHVLRSLRKHSTPAYRGYLSLCFDWDHYASHQGRLALPTRPEVLRDPDTQVILDDKGQPIVGALVKNRDGTPRKDKDGNFLSAGNRRVKAWNDPRAVRTGKRERNPQADRYPVYEADDLVRLCYPAAVYNDAEIRRQMRHKARRAIRRIEAQGGCVIETVGPRHHDLDGPPWRILPPDQEDGKSG